MTCPWSRTSTVLGILAVLITTLGAGASYAAPAEPVDIEDLRISEIEASKNELRETVLRITIPGLADVPREGAREPRKLVLYLDDHPLPLETLGWGKLVHFDNGGNRIVVRLERKTDLGALKKVWAALLGAPTGLIKSVPVSIGWADGFTVSRLDSVAGHVEVPVFAPSLVLLSAILVVGAFGLFLYLARHSNIIRDSGPPYPPEGQRRPYSLARTQMAFWFFLVFASYLFIFLATGDLSILNAQVLALIGIAAGTALGSAAIDASKAGQAMQDIRHTDTAMTRATVQIAEEEKRILALELKAPRTPDEDEQLKQSRAKLAEHRKEVEVLQEQKLDAKNKLQKPISENFWADILTDKDGISFHRFQIAVWTTVLGIIFCYGVWQDLNMPEFDATLLALMGISSGTYLGFKFPEKQV